MTARTARVVFFVSLGMAPGLAAAAGEPVGVGQAMQVFAGLAIVLVLIVAASWGARRLQRFRPQGRGHIRVVEGLAVGTREKLLLIEVDDQRVLLGMCPGRIQTLARFDTRGGAPAAAFESVLADVSAERGA